jgi:resuscitation-promoting factor RpfB
MSKSTIAAASAMAALALPAAATAAVPSTTAHRYQADYHAVAQKFGPRAPGRNILKSGLANGKRATTSEVLRSIATLERMLHPAPVVHKTYVPAPAAAPSPPPAAPAAAAAPAPAPAPAASAPASTTSTAPATTQSSGGGGYAIPGYIVQCESGGNWHAVNPSSGAGGAYQIMPSTWRAYGGSGLPQDASPAQQSAIASKIWSSAGAGAWQCAH